MLRYVTAASSFSSKAKLLVCCSLLAFLDKISSTLRRTFSLNLNLNISALGCSFAVGHVDDLSILLLGEPWAWKYLNPTMEQGTFVDVGSHIGKYTVTMAKVCEKVVAIEPESRNFNLLLENCARNGVLEKVHAINCALWDEDGALTMYRCKTGEHTVVSDRGEGSFKCESQKLDTLTSKLKINSIELVKIDVEGAELEVLRGGLKTLKTLRPRLIVEVRDENLEPVLRFLASIDYKCSKVPGSCSETLCYLLAEPLPV